MSFSTIAIFSPGVMGSGIGKFLALNGYRVITGLDGRSEYTRKRAADNGIEDAGDLQTTVAEADLVLSVLDPAKAVPLAKEVAAAMEKANHRPVYADCNATSPQTATELQRIIEGAGGIFIDVGIIGSRPKEGSFPMFATSGPQAGLLDELDGKAVAILNVGPHIGQGSAIKICNGAWNKGAFALYTAVMLAAEKYGFTDILRERLPGAQAGTVAKIDAAITRLPSLAHRYIGEMDQVAETFAAIDMPSGFHSASAELFRMLYGTSLGKIPLEELDPARTPLEVLKLLVAELDAER